MRFIDRVLKRSIATVVALVFFGCRASSAFGQPGPLDDTQRKVVAKLEAELPTLVRRDAAGAVVAVTIPSKYKDETTLAALSSITSIEKIKILGNLTGRVPELTSSSISHLAVMTNLVSLELACFPTNGLRPGVLTAIGKLSRLKEVQLYYADAPAPEYEVFSSLKRLRRLDLDSCSNFGDEQLRSLAQLPELKSVVLIRTGVTAAGTNDFVRTAGITNIFFISKRINLEAN